MNDHVDYFDNDCQVNVIDDFVDDLHVMNYDDDVDEIDYDQNYRHDDDDDDDDQVNVIENDHLVMIYMRQRNAYRLILCLLPVFSISIGIS